MVKAAAIVASFVLILSSASLADDDAQDLSTLVMRASADALGRTAEMADKMAGMLAEIGRIRSKALRSHVPIEQQLMQPDLDKLKSLNARVTYMRARIASEDDYANSLKTIGALLEAAENYRAAQADWLADHASLDGFEAAITQRADDALRLLPLLRELLQRTATEPAAQQHVATQ